MLYDREREVGDGQLGQNLAQRIQDIYSIHLGHQPSRISCQLADNTLTVVIEDSITLPELLLAKNDQQQLAEQIRVNIHQALHRYLKEQIEEAVKVPVVDLLIDFNFETSRSSVVAVLASAPDNNN